MKSWYMLNVRIGSGSSLKNILTIAANVAGTIPGYVFVNRVNYKGSASKT